MFPEILVRVLDGSVKGDDPDVKEFKFPSIKPLFDLVAVKEYWDEQKRKHENRYKDVPEPLRALMRERSRKDDGNMLGYRNAVLDLQKKLNPVLIKQLIGEIGEGVSIVVGPMILEDIGGGKTVKMKWTKKGKMHQSFKFTEDVRRRFCEWAEGQVEGKFGGV